jgi:alpha,alpha-trehalase
MIRLDDVWVVGNHGVEIAEPHGEPVPRPDIVSFADRIASAAQRCALIAAETPGLVMEDKRWSLSVHYRLADPSIVAALSARIATIARELGLRLTYGRRVLELQPPLAVDKGTAALDIARRLSALARDASILCAGDDRTDEDAFRALRAAHPRTLTIRVGGEPGLQQDTTAEFSLPNVDGMREFLDALLSRRMAATRV